MRKTYAVLLFLILLEGCDNHTSIEPEPTFGQPHPVNVIGYSGNSMEPFLSRDGTILFFNNLNSAPENTNLHWATRTNDSTFQYQGEISGINTPSLDAVASLDQTGNLYFVSDRQYASTLSTIYVGIFSNGTVSNISLVAGISKNLAGWVNFDVETNAAGTQLYYVDGRFDLSGGPYESDFVTATKTGVGFQRLAAGEDPLRNINTSSLEYAACISMDNLEFYFTRVTAPLTSSSIPEIFRCSRKNLQEAFGVAVKIESITGFVEAPTLSPDGKIVYYHKKEGGIFVIYMVRKK